MSRILALLLLSSTLLSQDLKVVVTAPQGPTTSLDQSQRIMVTFDQPMVPLRSAPIDEHAGPMTIEPAIPGVFRWMGTSTLVFVPAHALPFATRYAVTVPAGTRSLSGATLPAALQWTFDTPRPKVVRTTPRTGASFIELDHAIRIQFNQPVNPAEVGRGISLTARTSAGQTYPAFTTTADTIPNAIVVTPTAPFPKGATITVLLTPGIIGIQGPLSMGQPYEFSFKTFNELAFIGVSDSAKVQTAGSLVFTFTNPVEVKTVPKFLTFSPPLTLREDVGEYNWSSESVPLAYDITPERSYRGVLKAGLKDRFGNVLTKDVPFTFTTGPYEPYVSMAQGIGIVEATEKHRYPYRSLNVEKVTVQMGLVDTSTIISTHNAMVVWGKYDANDEEVPGQKLFTLSKEVEVKGTRNQQAIRTVNLDDVLEGRSTGIVALQLDSHLPNRRFLKALFQVTNLGITGKFSPESILLWVTTLKNAAAVAGASVELRDDANHVVWRGTTDQDGIARAPGWDKFRIKGRSEWQRPRVWAIVTKGTDIAFTNSEWTNGIEPWQFEVPFNWNPRSEAYRIAVFSDRGLYKAGETAGLKAIVRVRKGGDWRIPTKPSLRVTIRDPRNEVVLQKEPSVSPFGSFHLDVPLASGAPLGTYSVNIETKTGDQWTYTSGTSFRVEAFRAAEFDVTVSSGQKEAIIGDTLRSMIGGRYLFGAAMKNEHLAWRVSVSRTSWTPPGYDGWWFGELGWLTNYAGDSYGRMLGSGDGTLNEQGVYPLTTPVPVGTVRGTSSVTIEADVTSPSRQMQSGRTSILLHGGEYYPAIAPSSTFLAQDSLLTYRLLAVRPDGKPLADRALTVRIIKREWRSVRKAETGGRYAWQSVVDDVVKDSSIVVSGAQAVTRQYRPSEVGFYYIDVQSTDQRGNPLVAQCTFYCTGSGYVPWERKNDDRIDLVADKSHYAPGTTARVMVKSPYERATALITIEREGVLQHWTKTLIGSAPSIDIPIRSTFLPNVFVSVVLLQGRVDTAARTRESDVGRPSFKVGYVKLSVSPVERALAVTATPSKSDYRPGDSVTVTFKVKSAAGKGVRAEIAVSVADQGVLNLIGYKLGNPFDQFYAEQALGVTTTETRMHLVEQRNYDEKGEPSGGGGMMMKAMADMDAAGEGIRKDFRPSAYWNPSLTTDASGNATVRFKLPDNVTSFQIMAVAHTVASEFGGTDAGFTVSKPLLLQPALPRFARVGDTFDGGVVIFNHASASRTVTLVSTAQGIAFMGKETTTVVVPAGQATEVRHPYAARKVGRATFRFIARAGDEMDGAQWVVPIQVPRQRDAIALSGTLDRDKVQEAVLVPRAIERDLGSLELSASSTALVGLSGGISYLFTYPYGCLEQRLSSALPVILAEDLVKAFRFEVFKNDNYREVVQKTIADIGSYQHYSGGFVYWKGGTDPWPYLSAYAIYALTQAERHGYTVNRSVLDNGVGYIKRVLQNDVPMPAWSNQRMSLTTRALIVYTLALRSSPDHGAMEQLYRQRQDLPLFAKAYLLKALKAGGGNPTMIADLAQDLMNRAKVSPTSASFEDPSDKEMPWLWASTARTTALILQALVETQPQNPLMPKVVRWLLDEQKQGRWRTTQENIYVVDALATYFNAYEKDEPNFTSEVRLAGGTALSAMFKGRTFAVQSRSVPVSDLQPGTQYPLEFTKNGPGRLYYGVRLFTYPTTPSAAAEEGLTVLKKVEPLGGSETSIDTIAAGATVRVTLTIVTNQVRNYVVVEDPLPAGLEAVNAAFQTTAQTGPHGRERMDAADDEEGGRSLDPNPFNHVEQRDDRVMMFADYLPAGVHTYSYLARATSFGTFRVPSTRAEGMYEPEVNGQTAQQVIVVR